MIGDMPVRVKCSTTYFAFKSRGSGVNSDDIINSTFSLQWTKLSAVSLISKDAAEDFSVKLSLRSR